jgi:uncharacterized protein YkwD
MPRRSRLAGSLLGLLLSAGCTVVEVPIESEPTVEPGSPPAAEAPAPADQQVARAIFDRVNAERAERGAAPVDWSDPLAEVARQWSAAMAETGRLEHQDMQALLERAELAHLSSVGENIFTSTGPVPAGTIHAGWMRSDSHRGNVVNPGWDRLGVGVFCAPDGSVWATQEFGRTRQADRPPVAEETPPQQPLVRPEDDGPSCG